MSQVSKILATKINPLSGKSEILLRLRHGRGITLRAKTHLFVSPNYFVRQRNGRDAPGEIVVKSRVTSPEVIQAKEVRNKIEEMCRLFEERIYEEKPENITQDWLQKQVDMYIYGDKDPNKVEAVKPKSFFDHFDDFLAISQFSESRRKHFLVLYRALQRYALYRHYEISFDTFNPAII
ncbi:MAG: hypothetical protein PHG38_10245, partial [Bacteroidales bacterium]|nr:hypothetical protein [Bacteroidales bacterium]